MRRVRVYIYNLEENKSSEEIEDGGVVLESMKWGVITKGGRFLINGRVESILKAGSGYLGEKGGEDNNRCVVIVQGYYEWYVQPGTNIRQPYYITQGGGEVHSQNSLFLLAGN